MAVLQHDLTKGDPQKHILLFALPLVQAMIFQAMYSAVDLFFAGRFLGQAGQAAVSVCGPVMNVFLRTVGGMGIGVSIFIGRRQGMGDDAYTLRGANTILTLYAIGAAAITVLGFLFTPAILWLVQTPAEALPMATTYLRIVFSGSVFTIGYSLINSLQRGFGDAKSSLYFVMISTLVNIVLDWALLAFTTLEAAGLALATVAAQAVSFLLGVAYFRCNHHMVDFRLRSFCFHKDDAKEVLTLGLPTSAQQLLITAAQLTLSGIANSFGAAATVAYGIGLRIDSFASLPASAVGDAVTAFASQNFSAGDEERALQGRKAGVRLSLAMGTAVGAVVFVFAPQLAGLFNADPEVVALATGYLRRVVPLYILVSWVHPASGFIRGTGNTVFPMFQSLMGQYVARLPVAFFCAYFLHMGLNGVAMAWDVAPMVSIVLNGLYLRSGRWRKGWERAKGRAAKK